MELVLPWVLMVMRFRNVPRRNWLLRLGPFAAIANRLMAAVFWWDGRSTLLISLFPTPPVRICILLLKSRQRSLNSHVQAVPDSPPAPFPHSFIFYM